MRIDLGIKGGLAILGARAPQLYVRRGAVSRLPELDRPQRRALERLDLRLGELRQALERLQRTSGASPTRAASRASGSESIARSAGALDLLPYATFTTLGSTEEVNTVPTSFTPRGPIVSGDTTSLPTVGGVYDGTQGDDTLSFEFRDDATVGSIDKLRVEVRDGAGDTIVELDYRFLPAGTELTLPNGLTLALGAGDVVKKDTFEVQVSTSVGSAVDPTKPFDGTRNDDPNFEPGFSVGAGSFEVNGVSIAVNADDSIDSLLARITASAAGVTASFDAATESVRLTQQQAGSAFDIVLSNDTSGFLAAAKLDGATSIPGQDGLDPIQEPIADVPSLSGIATGTFSVNGVQLNVDVDVDSLGDVLDRINASGAGVTATLDPESLILTIASDDPAATLTLSDGTSGLFSALEITPGSYAPGASRSVSTDPRLVREDRVRPLLRDVRRALNRIFQPDASLGDPVRELVRARSSLRESVVTSVFSGASAETVRLRTGFGIDLDLESEDGRILQIDGDRLERALASDAVELHALLFRPAGSSREPAGLIPGLLVTVDELQDAVDVALERIDSRGRIVDLRA